MATTPRRARARPSRAESRKAAASVAEKAASSRAGCSPTGSRKLGWALLRNQAASRMFVTPTSARPTRTRLDDGKRLVCARSQSSRMDGVRSDVVASWTLRERLARWRASILIRQSAQPPTWRRATSSSESPASPSRAALSTWRTASQAIVCLDSVRTVGKGRHQSRAGPEDPGPHGAQLDAEHRGRLQVAEAHHLGEDQDLLELLGEGGQGDPHLHQPDRIARRAGLAGGGLQVLLL